MSEPFIGEIRMVGFGFAPRGWALCDGQILPIAQNVALFSLIGTTYGGDGQTTFALPDLRGRVPIHIGQGAGLSDRVWGERNGSETEILTVSQIPAHNHNLQANSSGAISGDPGDRLLAQSRGSIYAPAPSSVTMNSGAISSTGSGQPHNNMPPYLAIYFIIALEGIFPSRN